MLWSLLLIVVGLTILSLGADWLVRGSARIALLMGIPPIAVGLTVVAFGTSTPELVVSVQGALLGQSDIAVGNVVGSNNFNIGVILGLTALICPIACNPSFVRREIPIVIAVTLLIWLAGVVGIWFGQPSTEATPMTLSRWAGGIFLGLLAIYTGSKWIRVTEREATDLEFPGTAGKDEVGGFRRYAAPAAFVVLGLVGMIVGANFFLQGSVAIARMAGISELVIGLTLVAAGTSLPELATSVVAAIRGESDISLGNIVGSNVFNVLGVLGATSLVRPLPLDADVVYRDLPVALLFVVLCVPIMLTGRRVSRWEGTGLFSLYCCYGYWLFATRQSETMPM